MAGDAASIGVDSREAGLVAEGAVPAGVDVGGLEDSLPPAVVDDDVEGDDVFGVEAESVVDAVVIWREGVGDDEERWAADDGGAVDEGSVEGSTGGDGIGYEAGVECGSFGGGGDGFGNVGLLEVDGGSPGVAEVGVGD